MFHSVTVLTLLTEANRDMAAVQIGSQNVQAASIWFLDKQESYATTKPYFLAFTPAGDIPRQNIVRKEVPVDVYDMRGLEDTFSLDRNGFMVMKFPSEHAIENWEDEQEVKDKHYPKITSQMEHAFPGTRCMPIFHQVRKRDSAFPLSTGENYTYGQPLRGAHVDMTRSSCEQLIQESVEVQDMDPSILKGILSGRYFVTNLWHPIRGPNQDWPLALCDQSTLDRESDLEVADYVTPTKTREHVMMYARDCHRWWYLSNQKTTEALFFQQHNSEQIEPSGIPHAAFFNPHSQQKEPRESIEVFCLCYYV